MHVEAKSKKSKQAILRMRAEALAKPLCEGAHTAALLEMLVFVLAHERYGIETKHIQEVYPIHEYTPLPCTPPFILGLMNLRRKILTVVNLKVLFGLVSEEETNQRVIVLHDSEREFALLCDDIEGIRCVATEEMQPGLPTLTGIRQELLVGVTMDRVVVLDGNKLLTSDHLVVNEEVQSLV